jgi:hypothetical protein
MMEYFFRKIMKFGLRLMGSRKHVGAVINYSYISVTTLSINVSHGSTVCIATAYGLDRQGVGVQVPVRSRTSLLHII